MSKMKKQFLRETREQEREDRYMLSFWILVGVLIVGAVALAILG